MDTVICFCVTGLDVCDVVVGKTIFSIFLIFWTRFIIRLWNLMIVLELSRSLETIVWKILVVLVFSARVVLIGIDTLVIGSSVFLFTA